MQKYIILFFSVMVFLTACTGDDAPAGIIEQPRMTSLLTEIHLTDGSLYGVPQVPDSLFKYGSAKYQAIFKKYNTNDKQFTASLKYYTTRPEKMTEIYDQISARIKVKIDSISKKSNTKNAVPQ